MRPSLCSKVSQFLESLHDISHTTFPTQICSDLDWLFSPTLLGLWPHWKLLAWFCFSGSSWYDCTFWKSQPILRSPTSELPEHLLDISWLSSKKTTSHILTLNVKDINSSVHFAYVFNWEIIAPVTSYFSQTGSRKFL